MGLKHTKVSGAGASPDPATVGGDDWNADHQVDTGGLLFAVASSAPSAPGPTDGVIKTYATDLVAGRAMPGWIGPDGLTRTPLQAFLGRNKVGWFQGTGDAGGGTSFGLVTGTSGSLAARPTSTTSFFTMVRRAALTSLSGSAGSTVGIRFNSAAMSFARGVVAGTGGFTNVWRFGVSDLATVADSRLFCGMIGSASAIGNVNPSSLANIIGVGTDAGETTLSIMHNDGSGSANKVALGANFPAQTLSTDMYEFSMFCAPCGSEVHYRVERLNTGDVATGTITTKLPAASQMLSLQLWRNSGTTAANVGVDIASVYIETDY
jgi:hypothetical protein